MNEDERLKERYVKFNPTELQRVAGQAMGEAHCPSIIKFAEGCFNKVFLLKANPGRESIARMPTPIAGAPHYTTASEVATIDFLRSVLNLPVPKVWAYSTSSTNPVGAEYMIMERVEGASLASRWLSLTTGEVKSVMTQIANRSFQAQRQCDILNNQDLVTCLSKEYPWSHDFCVTLRGKNICTGQTTTSKPEFLTSHLNHQPSFSFPSKQSTQSRTLSKDIQRCHYTKLAYTCGCTVNGIFHQCEARLGTIVKCSPMDKPHVVSVENYCCNHLVPPDAPVAYSVPSIILGGRRVRVDGDGGHGVKGEKDEVKDVENKGNGVKDEEKAEEDGKKDSAKDEDHED
ncbi:aminoglycoside phosphotransferase family protein [Aspergillus homomorphus CBS 101889]|uniref:Altered inheritance of mitochondria protein 9, mitochondrial n=1 Tax=Aspergillus homomorphus (strain CBS 101889) TaxID=1450537 RepID=A0A395HU71_ASPHC|nr:hypothetical protein BO97DRAFT_478507 [Aspergillus homomorphus CBS 101889]RAL11482.1 hypothetical protein BO97DRAFT_478507 [Aspergillus homomorphus CBS 101889]